MRSIFSQAAVPLLVVILLSGAIAVLNIPSLNSGLKNGVYSVVEPVQKSVWFAGAQVYGFFGSFWRMNSSVRENEHLKGRINELTSVNARIDELRKENEFLRQGLNLEISKDFDLKLADIVAKNIAGDSLIINKGSSDMIEVGMPVITSEKAVVGKISKIYDDFSEVDLITRKDFSFDVKIGDGMIDGLVKGEGGTNAKVDLVSKDKELQAGFPVVTSRMGGIFPAGLVIGTIKDIDKNDVETFQTAALSLAFDIHGASRVFIANAKYPLGLGAAPLVKNEQ